MNEWDRKLANAQDAVRNGDDETAENLCDEIVKHCCIQVIKASCISASFAEKRYDFTKALHSYRQALLLDPQHQEAKDGAQRIATLLTINQGIKSES